MPQPPGPGSVSAVALKVRRRAKAGKPSYEGPGTRKNDGKVIYLGMGLCLL